jgi:hypothetical protein
LSSTGLRIQKITAIIQKLISSTLPMTEEYMERKSKELDEAVKKIMEEEGKIKST